MPLNTMPEPTHQGTIPFHHPSTSTPYHTFYKVFGDLKAPTSPPLLLLHGGPGSGHEYPLPLTHLPYPIIIYDQIGCGQSTHLHSHPERITIDLFVAELQNLVHRFDLNQTGFNLLGHSWGGMLATAFAATQPPGLKRLVLYGASADGEIFHHGLQKLRHQLSPPSQEAITHAVETNNFTNETYLAAMKEFQRKHLCHDLTNPYLLANFQNQAQDRTVRTVMQGPSPFVYDGLLRHYSSIPLLPRIQVPTLVFKGENDATQYEATAPFFEGIGKVRWVTLIGASHMPHLDSEESLQRVLDLVESFLR